MNMPYKKSLFVIFIISIGIAILLIPDENPTYKNNEIEENTKPSNEAPRENEQKAPASINPRNTAPKPKDRTVISKKNIPEGVNTIFHDKPETQVVWMERGKNIVIKNYTYADAADFQKTFFHRGAKARPVTCGEVQFRSEGKIIDEYQRFIYTGIQSTFLETDVQNFDIFWSIMCEQTLHEYFDEPDQQ